MKKITLCLKLFTFIFFLNFPLKTLAQCPENITVDSETGQCGAVVDYEIEGSGLALSDNGIVNGSASNGFTGWTLTNGGTGWGIAGTSFITSYITCTKYQVVDLSTMGLTDAYMDTQPAITVSDDYKGGGSNMSDTYILTVQLRGENDNIIATYTTGNITTTANWQTAMHTFTSYGAGVRKVYFSHGGKDAEFWAGQYGSMMTNAQVVVAVPTSTVVQTAGLESGSVFPVGTTTNTFEITDADNNTSTCSFDVTVNDVEAPTVITQNITVALDESGLANITGDEIDNGSFENCGNVTTELDITSFSCENLGENIVTLSMNDGVNTATATAIVTVVDDIAPVAIGTDMDVVLDMEGMVVLNAEEVGSASTDNCSIATYQLSKTIFTCEDIGQNNVTLTVYDAQGNSSDTQITVTVNDNVLPTVITQNITIQLSAVTITSISAMDIDNGSYDNCGISTYSLNSQVFTCEDLGENEVTLTVTDNYGNQNTATAIVTVEDTENYCQFAAINSNLAKTLKVYPNPFHDVINISSDELPISKLEIYDISGRAVKTITSGLGNNFTVNLSQFNSGLYILKLSSEDKSTTIKLNKI